MPWPAPVMMTTRSRKPRYSLVMVIPVASCVDSYDQPWWPASWDSRCIPPWNEEEFCGSCRGESMMEFGLQFFPDISPAERSGQDYWNDCLELVGLCDEL